MKFQHMFGKIDASDWVSVNIDTEHLKEEHELEGGFRITVSPSPYDVPGAVQAQFDRGKGEVRILFRYIGTEPIKHRRDATGVVFGMGKNSGRLYEVGVPVSLTEGQGLDLHDFAERISREIDRVPSASDYPERQENYRLAKEAIKIAEAPLSSTFLPLFDLDASKSSIK